MKLVLLNLMDTKEIPLYDQIDGIKNLSNGFHEQIITDVLRQALGRQPKNEDAKEVTLLCDNGMLSYWIKWRDKILGKVEERFHEDSCSWKVTFQPTKP